VLTTAGLVVAASDPEREIASAALRAETPSSRTLPAIVLHAVLAEAHLPPQAAAGGRGRISYDN